jgi:hypothetical protein
MRGEGMKTRNKERVVTSIGIKAKDEQATEIFFFLWAGRLAEGWVVGHVASRVVSTARARRRGRGEGRAHEHETIPFTEREEAEEEREEAALRR